MKNNMIAYICTCRRNGKDLWLGMKDSHPFVGEKSKLMPILFGSDDEALDALMTHTSFKGWRVQEVIITNS